MHGALHLFDSGTEIIKEEYDGTFLLSKVKERMSDGEYPIFVAAGNGEEKLNHIYHNRYLLNCYESLSNIQGSLVTFGFNFGPYDDHIVRAINKASKGRKDRDYKERLLSLYIGVFSESDKLHIKSIRDKFKVKKVALFDAKSINPWKEA